MCIYIYIYIQSKGFEFKPLGQPSGYIPDPAQGSEGEVLEVHSSAEGVRQCSAVIFGVFGLLGILLCCHGPAKAIGSGRPLSAQEKLAPSVTTTAF